MTNGIRYRREFKLSLIRELERLVGKLYAENDFLNASRSGYYKWLHNSHRNAGAPNSDISIREEMQNIVIEFPGYGYRKVKIELRNRGYK